MRLAVAVLVMVLVAFPALGVPGPLAIPAEIGAGVVAVGLYSCFVAGIFSDVTELSATLQGATLSEVSLPRATILIAGGAALMASPLVAAAAVTAVGESVGVNVGSAFAFSVVFAYAGAAIVFDREWRRDSAPSRWLPGWLPEWAVTLTVTTALAATIGFNIGLALNSP